MKIFMNIKIRHISLLLLAVFLGFGAAVALSLSRVPGEIRLTEFTSHRLNIGLPPPIRATLCSTTSVIKVEERADLRSFTLKTDAPGQAEMTIGVFGLPMRRVVLDIVPEVKLVPLGTAIGVRINTDGVMVLGMGSFLGEDGEPHRPSEGVLQAGDLIFKVDGTAISSKEELSQHVADSTGNVRLSLRREGEMVDVTLTPATAATDGVRRIGAWVRDSTKGIGTLTYYDPSTGNFGALGHGIMDVDTKKLMSVRSGMIMPSNVTSVKRGTRGAPGELIGNVNTNRTLGQISANNESGIYGKLSQGVAKEIATRPAIPIALRTNIKEGPATILTSIGDQVQEFEIYIESINRFTQDETKGMVIRITDPKLLEITGGIVQGMSGSPILQDGRLVGAVTHVFVQDPTKGYGIFIESMMHNLAQPVVVYCAV